MINLEFTDTHLVVRLSFWQRAASFSGDLHVALSNLRGASIDTNAMKEIGWRAGGTGWFTFAAGHFRKRGQRRFVYWHLKDPVVRVDLANEKNECLFLGFPDQAAASAFVDEVNLHSR